MTDQTPSTPEPTPTPAQPTPPAAHAGQSGGVNISGGPVSVGGDIVGGDKSTTNTSAGQGNSSQPKPATRPGGFGEASVKSSWANGLFYLFAFLAIVGVLGWIASMVSFSTLALIVVGGIIAVPVIGALQLRMDKRLSEKSFLSLMKMSIAQLPVIGGLVKK